MCSLDYKRCSEASFKRLLELRNSFESKQRMCTQKAHRARNYDKIEEWSQKGIMYRNLWRRCHNLIFEMRDISADIRYESDRMCELNRYKAKLKEKEEKRQLFLTKYRYGLWFFSNSFHADYGTFICSICGIEFYHSPARIYLAGKVIYGCCCGNCTNNLIGTDNGRYPYE